MLCHSPFYLGVIEFDVFSFRNLLRIELKSEISTTHPPERVPSSHLDCQSHSHPLMGDLTRNVGGKQRCIAR